MAVITIIILIHIYIIGDIMKKCVSMAIIGGGISGLSLAASLVKHPSLHVTLIEKQATLGGRVYTQEVTAGQYADLGANIIDFQNSQQQGKVRHFLSKINGCEQAKLHLLKQPFLIFQDDKLRNGDYQKERFYYKNGFKQLVADLQSFISAFPQQCSVLPQAKIAKISRKESKWIIHDDANKLAGQQFDLLVLSCNGHGIIQILKASGQQQLVVLLEQVAKVKYTKQISLAFEAFEANYSCILFKNNPITFISSHIEKYPQQPPLIVMQMNEPFSQKHFDMEDSIIEEAVRHIIPNTIKNDIGKCIRINRWWPSLIRQKKTNSIKKILQASRDLFVVGDVISGASRVANAIESSLLLSQQLEALLCAKL